MLLCWWADGCGCKKKGFLNIHVASGNYFELKDLIFKTLDKSKEKFIYVRGEFVSNDLENDFKEGGFLIKSVINYTTEPNLNTDLKLIAGIPKVIIPLLCIPFNIPFSLFKSI